MHVIPALGAGRDKVKRNVVPRRTACRRAERSLYLADRTLLDVRAAQRRRLGRRLIRRAATRFFLSALRSLNRGYK